MGFALVRKLVTMHDLERCNGHYFTIQLLCCMH